MIALLPKSNRTEAVCQLGLLKKEYCSEFNDYLKFQIVPPSESVDGSERYRILRWCTDSQSYQLVGGQWYLHEVEQVRRCYDQASSKNEFSLDLEILLDGIAIATAAATATECGEVAL